MFYTRFQDVFSRDFGALQNRFVSSVVTTKCVGNKMLYNHHSWYPEGVGNEIQPRGTGPEIYPNTNGRDNSVICGFVFSS